MPSWLRKKIKQGEDKKKAPSGDVTEQQVLPAHPPMTDAQVPPATSADTEAKVPQLEVSEAPLSTSQRLWNDAYDSLENGNDTAKLVKAYAKTLTMVLNSEKVPDNLASGASDISTELKESAKRQEYMKKLVKEGQARVSMASKTANMVGDVAQFIISAKGMIDLAIQNIPQAALPWAGVCVGLQVSRNPL